MGCKQHVYLVNVLDTKKKDEEKVLGFRNNLDAVNRCHDANPTENSHIVRIKAKHESENKIFYVTDQFEGQTLAALLKAQKGLKDNDKNKLIDYQWWDIV